MEFQITNHIFRHLVSDAQRAVPSRTATPILTNLLVATREQKLTITGFDDVLLIEASTEDVTITASGEITLPSTLLGDLISHFPSDKAVTLAQDTEDSVTISCDRSTYSLKAISADDYPNPPNLQPTAIAELNPKLFLNAVERVLTACASDQTRQILTGIHLKAIDHNIELTATDGHRMALVPCSISSEETISPITLPCRSPQPMGLAQIYAALKDLDFKETPLKVYFDPNYLAIMAPGLSATCRSINGDFPQCRDMIPKDWDIEATVNKPDLLAAIDRINIFNNDIKLSLDPQEDSIALQSNGSKDIGFANEFLPASITWKAKNSQPLNIAFQCAYLRDAVAATPHPDIFLKFRGAQSPVLIHSADSGKYIVMPLKAKG